MIQVKELMIGDYVLAEGKPTKVLGVYTRDDVERLQIGGQDNYWVIVEINSSKHGNNVITPIPLTAEILEKNGIKFQYGKVWYQLHNDRVQLAWEHNGDTIRLCVDYVHQCQHALRLCGLNELAENFQVI